MASESFKNDLRVYLELTCRFLVDEDDTVSVDYVSGERTTVFRIHSSNIGPILGKKGRLIKALRDIVISVANKHRIRCVIEVVENLGESDLAA